MPKIRVLDKALAELIAAGEVVERPASIAKELIENAVDAGASAVTIEIEGGGVRLLRVGDNGCGIARGDIPTAFLRHATSKIASQGDLDAIATLGFRGEALASVAAMAKVELLSKTSDEHEGTRYLIEGGQELELAPAGCPNGTVITVRELFYNTPARMKFLKKDIGEGNAVAQVVDKLALAYPGVALKFIRDGKLRLQTSGSGELLPVLAAVYGKDFADGALAVEHDMPGEGISVRGYVTAPEGAKPSRAYQNFFLNTRYVRTRTAAAALEEAFKTYVGGGKFPGCALHIEIRPELVDVNVHPAKIEVRFANEKPVFSCVYFAVKSVLARGGGATPPSAPDRDTATLRTQPAAPQGRMSSEQFRALYTPRERGAFGKPLPLHSSAPKEPGWFELAQTEHIRTSPDVTINATNASIEPESGTIITDTGAQTRGKPHIIGELAGVYILLEWEGGLLLVDKHAAHERIIYERLRRELSLGNRQLLLQPLTLNLAPEDHGALLEHPGQLEALGFALEDFGGNAVLVRETPLEMARGDVALLLEDIAAKLRGGNIRATPDALDRLLFSIACKGAVRARDKNSLPELQAIADLLWQDGEVTHCPHGRPVMATLSAREIDKMFGRQGG